MNLDRFRKAHRHLREYGFVDTARVTLASLFYYPFLRWLDGRFDRMYGTDTTETVHRDDLAIDSELLGHARGYAATPDRTFVRFLRKQALDYSDYTFVDLGCGKGRTLLLAAQFPFKKIVGVEVEPRLHSICLNNIATYVASPKASRRPIEALRMNAADYEFPDGNILLYMFNPFGPHVMDLVAQKMRRAIESGSRCIRIVYFHPNHSMPFLTLPGINLVELDTFHCRASMNNLGRVATFEMSAPGDDSASKVIDLDEPRPLTKSSLVTASLLSLWDEPVIQAMIVLA